MCVADLDSEDGSFHGMETAGSIGGSTGRISFAMSRVRIRCRRHRHGLRDPPRIRCARNGCIRSSCWWPARPDGLGSPIRTELAGDADPRPDWYPVPDGKFRITGPSPGADRPSLPWSAVRPRDRLPGRRRGRRGFGCVPGRSGPGAGGRTFPCSRASPPGSWRCTTSIICSTPVRQIPDPLLGGRGIRAGVDSSQGTPWPATFAGAVSVRFLPSVAWKAGPWSRATRRSISSV